MDTVFWATAQLFWLVVRPDRFVLLLLALGSVCLWTRWRSLGRKLVSLSVGIVVVLNIVALDAYLLVPLEERFPQSTPPEQVDGIIVLGGAIDQFVSVEREQLSISDAGERVVAMVDLARRYPNAQVVYSGGNGSIRHAPVREAEVARRWVRRRGMLSERFSFETESRNTWENGTRSQKLVQPKKGETWLLVTSAAHMPRAIGVFRKIGWPVVAYPVDYQTAGKQVRLFPLGGFGALGSVSAAVHEWIGLVVYWVTGKTSALFPAPRSAG